MKQKRYDHSSLIIGNKFLLVLFGRDDYKFHKTIEYVDLDAPVTFVELEPNFTDTVQQNWFSGCLIYHTNPREFPETKQATLLILGGLEEVNNNQVRSSSQNNSSQTLPVYELTLKQQGNKLVISRFQLTAANWN